MRKKFFIRSYEGYFYILPWVVGFLVLTLYPFLISLWYAFTDYNMATETFIGLRNFKEIFTDDPIFFESFKITAIYTLVTVPCKLIVALLCAMALTKASNAMGFYRTCFYLPSIFGGSVALAILWKYLFKHDGLINEFLVLIKITPINWLGDPKIALFTLMLLPLWQMGAPMVIFIAALKNVPEELLEAARIDGASNLRIFFSIKLPLITNVILFNLIQQTITIIQMFTPAYVITQGGPIKSTYLYSLMLYDVSFRDFRMGYASALSWILFIVLIIYTVFLFKTSNKWVYSEEDPE